MAAGFVCGAITGALAAVPIALGKGATAELLTGGLSMGIAFAATTLGLVTVAAISAGCLTAGLARKKAEKKIINNLSGLFSGVDNINYAELKQGYTHQYKQNKRWYKANNELNLDTTFRSHIPTHRLNTPNMPNNPEILNSTTLPAN